ncbi:MAG: phage tail protein [Planctomycetota bacterium]
MIENNDGTQGELPVPSGETFSAKPVTVVYPANIDDADLKRRVEEIAAAYLVRWLGIGLAVLGVLITVFSFLFYFLISTNAEKVARNEAQQYVQTQLQQITTTANQAASAATLAANEARIKIGVVEELARRADIDFQQRVDEVSDAVEESERRVMQATSRSQKAAEQADEASVNAAAINQEVSRLRAELEGTDVDEIRRELAQQPDLIASRLKGDEDFQLAIAQALTDLPVGSIIPSAAPGPVPDGWVEADGRLLDRVKYASLFRVIGTIYSNTDDPIDQFRLPDLRMRTVIGTDSAVGAVIGAKDHTHGMSHSHRIEGARISARLSGTTSEARYTSRDPTWHTRRDRNNFEGERDGYMIYRANEDTLSESKAQHNHTVTVSGNIAIPDLAASRSDRSNTASASSYQPSMKVRMLIKAR